MYGLTDEEIAAIREGKFESFAPPELALLRMADAMADTPSNVSDELFAELRRHFSEEELIALMAKHPDLIQRPIVVCGDQAVLGRPPENVENCSEHAPATK